NASKPFELPDMDHQNDRQSYLRSYILEKERTYLINESALKVFGWKSPEEAIGKRIDWRNAAFQTRYGEIIGVVKDYHYASLQLKIRPLLLMNEPLFLSVILVKIQTQDIASILSYMQNVWDRLFPNLPMPYEFVDDLFAGLYRTEQRQNQLLLWFSAAAIFIAYLGLFGLASFTAEQRNKEISVRKVMGASVPNILSMLLKEFTRWILLAAVFACPIAYWAMNRWLQNYVYRIEIEWWPFVIATGLAFLIAILTVSYQSIKAATANPVESLRYE
ncbi:MAG: ABC transporter permease, partial [Candidatus Hodarchaeota archaeon]